LIPLLSFLLSTLQIQIWFFFCSLLFFPMFSRDKIISSTKLQAWNIFFNYKIYERVLFFFLATPIFQV
jgi:hypothetical protein